MVRWLERNGYDVSYFTGVDADRRGARDPRTTRSSCRSATTSTGRRQQRANVEAARDAGVNLAFFSGNEIFWKTRWENSIDGSGTAIARWSPTRRPTPTPRSTPTGRLDRHLAGPALQPASRRRAARERADRHDVHGRRRAPRAIQVPAADGKLRLWRNTSVASLEPGETATLGDDTLGYEWDEDLDNGFRPAGLIDLSSTTVGRPEKLLDYGSTYGPGTATHHHDALPRTQRRAGLRRGHGAVVVGSRRQPRSRRHHADAADAAGHREPVRRHGRPARDPAGGPVAATQSTDTTPPDVDDHVARRRRERRRRVAGHDHRHRRTNGETPAAWSAASKSRSTAARPGTRRSGARTGATPGRRPRPAAATIRARAVDDSGNIETPAAPGDGRRRAARPARARSGTTAQRPARTRTPTTPIELGVKFRSDFDGFDHRLPLLQEPPATPAPTSGTCGRRAAPCWHRPPSPARPRPGWQQVDFDSPVADQRRTPPTSSPITRRPATTRRSPATSPPAASTTLRCTRSRTGATDPMASTTYGRRGAFPNEPDASSGNYWVDVVFDRRWPRHDAADVVTAGSRSRAPRTSPATTIVTATFNEPMNPATISLDLRASGPGERVSSQRR